MLTNSGTVFIKLDQLSETALSKVMKVVVGVVELVQVCPSPSYLISATSLLIAFSDSMIVCVKGFSGGVATSRK